MQLKKFGLMMAAVLTAGVALSGCSIKEKLRTMVGPSQENQIELETSVSPAVMTEEAPVENISPEPSQSKSSEVKDLELDLKAVKFDQESFE
jgi:hypothetical protein